MAGLVPAISLGDAQYPPKRDHRDKPGDDKIGYDPPEGWGWCYVDEAFVKLPNTTKQVGPIKRWV
jgi:hypothetical protein